MESSDAYTYVQLEDRSGHLISWRRKRVRSACYAIFTVVVMVILCESLPSLPQGFVRIIARAPPSRHAPLASNGQVEVAAFSDIIPARLQPHGKALKLQLPGPLLKLRQGGRHGLLGGCYRSRQDTLQNMETYRGRNRGEICSINAFGVSCEWFSDGAQVSGGNESLAESQEELFARSTLIHQDVATLNKIDANVENFDSTHESRRSILFQLFRASLTLPVLPPIAATPAAATAVKDAAVQTFSITKAPLDPRSYRGLILGNGLRILLASDPSVAKGAAAMDVQVGYLTDPSDLPGLAHFCEHMLFLGTKPFPDEDGFERLLSTSGGSSNAFTAEEETNYYFDVQGSILPAALERFASFFTAPLFTQSATAREVNAINSEHQKNLQSEAFRFSQLFKLRANPEHPFGKFGTGNASTLRNGDDVARKALLKYHERYYQADRMSLVIIGPQNLKDLQSLAVKNFAAVPVAAPRLPRASAAYDSLPLPFSPATEPPIATLMVPVNELRLLRIAWCLPVTDLDGWIATKPDGVWSLLVSNAGEGGLLPLLKRQGLANSLEASPSEFTRSFAILEVSVSLTELGLEKWKTVASMLFAYLRKLSAAGVPKYVVSEFATMAAINFEYAEPNQPQSFASSKAGDLEMYSPEKWVVGPATVESGAEIGAAEMLAFCANPRNALITVVAKEVESQATKNEPIYGTKYSTVSLVNEMREWSASSAPSELAPPGPNPFLPKDFGIRCSSGGQSLAAAAMCSAPKVSEVAPTVITSQPGVTVHFLQDSTFLRPKALAYFLFRSPLLSASPKATITSGLFSTMLADTLQEATYQASIAGQTSGLGASYDGLLLTASGYNSRLPDVTQYVATQIKTAELQPLVFDRVRGALRQQFASFPNQQPVALASYYRGLSLEQPSFSIEQLQKAVEAATLEDVRAFQKNLFPECLLEAFLVGNLNEEEARKITAATTAVLPVSTPLEPESIPRHQVRILPVGRTLRQYAAQNPAETNSATEVYLQVGMDKGDDWIYLALLFQLLQEPFYNQLRTKQQLGYIVSASLDESEGVRGLLLRVQSAVLGPEQVEGRIDTFLKNFRQEIATMSEKELAAECQTLATIATDVDKRLGSQASRLWAEIFRRRYDYGRPWRVARRFAGLTRAGLLAFYDLRIMPGAPEGRRLATHVFARSSAPKMLVVDTVPDDFYPSPEDLFGQIKDRRKLA